MTLARAREIVTLAVRSGCFDKSELADLIEDHADDEADVATLRALVVKLSDTQRAAEAKWEALTTNDRLTRAFAELRRRGIVAMENAGYNALSTPDDAWEAIFDEATNFDDPPHGGVFYCGEDLASAIAGKGLALTCGALDEVAFGTGTTIRRRDDAPLDELAKEICDALARHEVAARWTGERIAIAPFRWQRRAFTKAPKLGPKRRPR
jgi:uncharacterized protein DUF6891